MMDELGLAFFFTAGDAQGNTSSTDTIFVRKAFDTVNAPDIPDAKFGVGGKASDWKMFSIPYKPDNPSISSIFESVLGTYDKSKWRLVRYSSAGDNFVEYKSGLNTIEISKGYWFNSVSSENITLITMGSGKLPEIQPSQLVSIPMDNGWTQIGNPYPFTISWSGIINLPANNGAGLQQTIDIFDGSGLSSATDLGPFDAAYAFGNGTDIDVPFTSTSARVSRIK